MDFIGDELDKMATEGPGQYQVSYILNAGGDAVALGSLAKIDAPGSSIDIPTEGILKAEGMGWSQVVVELMKLVMPWKRKLVLTFVLGVLRVVGFIGVGVLSAMVILALKTGQPFAGYLWGLAVVAPLAGVLRS